MNFCSVKLLLGTQHLDIKRLNFRPQVYSFLVLSLTEYYEGSKIWVSKDWTAGHPRLDPIV